MFKLCVCGVFVLFTCTSNGSPQGSFVGINGGGHLSQIIPPGKPWPANPEDYYDPIKLIQNRFKETTTKKIENANPSKESSTVISLEYKPERPFYAGDTGGGHLSQIIPPGKPWPANAEDYTKKPIENRFQETGIIVENSTVGENSTTTETSTNVTSLEYKPERPFYAGDTGGGPLPQIIPPGKPLPANPLENRNKETTTSVETSTFSEDFSTSTMMPNETSTDQQTLFTSLEYKPTRPFNAGMVGGNPLSQIIPSDGPENSTTENSIQNRIKETITENNITSEIKKEKPFSAAELLLVPLISPDKPWSEIIKNKPSMQNSFEDILVFEEPSSSVVEEEEENDDEDFEDIVKEKEFFDEIYKEKSKTLSKALQDFVLINKLKEICFSDVK